MHPSITHYSTIIGMIAFCLFFSLTDIEPECEKSSATTYYWYREALAISSSISESGGLNWKMTGCLLAAWVMVCLAMIKGIQSSGKVSILESLLILLSTICGYCQPLSSISPNPTDKLFEYFRRLQISQKWCFKKSL